MQETTVPTLKNKKGSATIIALLLLVLLTIIAISTVNNSVIESQIVRNDTVHKDQLYRAEAAALEGVRWVENADGPTLADLESTLYLSDSDVDTAAIDMNDGGNRWQIAGIDPDQNPATVITGYTVVDETGLIDLSADSNVYTYKVYGYYDRPGGLDKGKVLIEIGYRKRF